MTRPDAYTLLVALRPGTAEEQGWDAHAQQVVRERILADPGAPGTRRTTRRRRFALALAGALVVTGGGAAAASGRIPEVFTDAFASWGADWSENEVTGADPATAERVATQPGPDGTVFSVVAAPTRSSADPDGPVTGACTVAVLETAASAREPGPADFQDVSSSGCQPSHRGLALGERGGIDVAYAEDSRLGVTEDLWVWQYSAGDAVTAQVVTADGRTWPALLHDGTLYGWVPAPADGERPVLVGYAADGTEVGRVEL